MRVLVPLLAFLLSAPAQAQVAQTWLRDALTPTSPNIHKTPSMAIYPSQTIPLRFSHAVHMKGDVDCESCHDMVGKSKTAVDKNIPAHAQCESCHDIEAAKRGEPTDPDASCAFCHPGVRGEEVPKDEFPSNNIHFSHETHMARGAKCNDCHTGAAASVLATRSNLPRMTTCLVCHDGTQAPNRCTECHLADPDGVLKTRFASGVLAPSGTLRDDDHGRDFMKRHAFVAQQDSESCNACHRVQECESCHASSSKAFRIHPPSFIQTHGMEARAQKMECASCHREQSFCISCHQQSGVAFAPSLTPNGASFVQPKKFHPPGFTSPSRSSANHHSFEAMSNPESCVGCHDEKTCLACHATSNVATITTGHPVGTNPHFPGFAHSAEACRAYHLAPFACAKCHGGGAGLTTLQAQMPGCR